MPFSRVAFCGGVRGGGCCFGLIPKARHSPPDDCEASRRAPQPGSSLQSLLPVNRAPSEKQPPEHMHQHECVCKLLIESDKPATRLKSWHLCRSQVAEKGKLSALIDTWSSYIVLRPSGVTVVCRGAAIRSLPETVGSSLLKAPTVTARGATWK